MEYNEQGQAVVNETDQCFDCAHYRKAKTEGCCPLMNGLANGIFFFPEDGFITVDQCGLYKSTGIRVVK